MAFAWAFFGFNSMTELRSSRASAVSFRCKHHRASFMRSSESRSGSCDSRYSYAWRTESNEPSTRFLGKCMVPTRCSTEHSVSVSETMPGISRPLVSSTYAHGCREPVRAGCVRLGGRVIGVAWPRASTDRQHRPRSGRMPKTIRLNVDMRGRIPKSPPAKEMIRRSLGTEMTLYGRNGGGTVAETLEFVKTTSSSY